MGPIRANSGQVAPVREDGGRSRAGRKSLNILFSFKNARFGRPRCAILSSMLQAEQVRAALPSRPGRVSIPIPSLSFRFLPDAPCRTHTYCSRPPQAWRCVVFIPFSSFSWVERGRMASARRGASLPMSSRCPTANPAEAGKPM